MKPKQKVGIVTLHHGNNYGAVYQAYALSNYIEGLGFEVCIIDYHMDAVNISSYIMNPIMFIRKVLSKKAFTLSFLKGKRKYQEGQQRERHFSQVFNNFRDNFLNITDAKYSYNILSKSPPDVDFLITGSDQVWADDFFFSSPAYLLDFGNTKTKKISYAPSFGKSSLEPYLHNIFKENISKFDNVSVREQSGVNIVKAVAGVDAVKVLDPTLLLDSYLDIIDYALVPESPYIITYRLSQENDLACWVTECVNKIARAKGLDVYRVSTNSPANSSDVGIDLEPTPGQLLGLIEKSSLMLTNSFHGTVFSILFQVNFLCFARDAFEDKQNLRMLELLGLVGLEKLFCQPFEISDVIDEKMTHYIDWKNVELALDNARLNSKGFLNQALGADY